MIRALISGFTPALPLITRDTVAMLTPLHRAISRIVIFSPAICISDSIGSFLLKIFSHTTIILQNGSNAKIFFENIFIFLPKDDKCRCIYS